MKGADIRYFILMSKESEMIDIWKYFCDFENIFFENKSPFSSYKLSRGQVSC